MREATFEVDLDQVLPRETRRADELLTRHGARSAASSLRVAPSRLGVLCLPRGMESPAIRRVVVPVPATDAEDEILVRRVWELTNRFDLDLLLVARVDRPDADLPVHRRLTNLSAMLHRRTRNPEISVIAGRTWLEVLRRVCREGDAVLAPAAQPPGESARRGDKRVTQVVERLRIPVYRMDGLPVDLSDRRLVVRPRSIIAWIAPLAVLALFALIQGGIVTQAHGVLQTLLLALSVGAELACLLTVESMVGLWR